MSGRHHRYDSVPPYPMGNATDSDDETYLQMDQFQEKDSSSRVSNIRCNLKNILTLQNDDQPALSFPRPNYGLSYGQRDQSTKLGINRSNQSIDHYPKMNPKPVVPSYSKWDPAKKATRAPAPIPGNPPLLPRLPPKPSDDSSIDDDQEAYLTFGKESSSLDQFHGYGLGQPKRWQLPQHPAEDPPPRPPRSPAIAPMGYDDHTLPLRLSPFDQPPERPPPLPPTQMSPNHTTPSFSRHGSDKSSSSVSPASSRPPSVKEVFSHLPERRSNHSTGSSGSASSDEITQSAGRSTPTPNKFVTKRTDRVTPQFSKLLPKHRPSLPTTMPSFELIIGISFDWSPLLWLFCVNVPNAESILPYGELRSSTWYNYIEFEKMKGAQNVAGKEYWCLLTYFHKVVCGKGTRTRFCLINHLTTGAALPFQIKVTVVADYEIMNPPSTPLEDQPYFKNLDRDTAQDAIDSVKQDGAFLVRPRHESSKPYALTLWANSKYYNFIIRERTIDGKFALGRKKEDEKAFDSVANLVEHFRTHEVVLAENEGCVKLTVSPP